MTSSAPRHNAEPLPVSYSELGSTAESFAPIQGVRELVEIVMVGRVDDRGQLLPIAEDRALIGGEHIMKPLPSHTRYDVVLPPNTTMLIPQPDGSYVQIGWDYSISGALQSGLTRTETLHLGAAGIERLRHEQTKLEHTLETRPGLRWGIDHEGKQDAYQITQTHSPAAGSDHQLIQPVRIYAPAGANGMQAARHIIDNGADVAFAKIWIPYDVPGEQEFRQDTPIFGVNTAEQLRATIHALRVTAAENSALFDKYDSPLGIPIAGVPGAYLAQPGGKKSFNGKMAQFWEQPIREACNSLPLYSGDLVTDAWLDEAAVRTRELARQRAESSDVNPTCHALVPGQDINIIWDALTA